VNHSPVQLLTINTGSSSLKAALYRVDDTPQLVALGEADRIGDAKGRLRVSGGTDAPPREVAEEIHSHDDALRAFLDYVREQGYDSDLDAVGHRIVHGGEAFHQPVRITDEVVAAIRDLIPIDPNHLPQALEAIETVSRLFPSVTQVACFDTAFHHGMPRRAQIYPLPPIPHTAGVRRYGFHGLSCESIMDGLAVMQAADGRVIIAHLGNGASMTAVENGRSIETTMGFTPTGGLVMGTRSGDLDPGLLLYLMRAGGMSPDEVDSLVTRQAGLLGVSGSNGDMRDLLERESGDGAAADAVELFCYTARKYCGALAAALGGLETLVFTGGIGEHAAAVRTRICTGLEFLGIVLDTERNSTAAPIISAPDSRVTVRVMHTDEDATIAKHTAHLLRTQGRHHVSL
jgi:acetate kinase